MPIGSTTIPGVKGVIVPEVSPVVVVATRPPALLRHVSPPSPETA